MNDFDKLQVTDTTTEEWQIRASSAFQLWTAQSNARIEARRFSIEPGIENTDIWKSDFLSRLHLRCMQDALPHKVDLSKELDEEEFLLAFKLAAQGGGAYGGVPEDTNFDKVVFESIGALMNNPNRFLSKELNALMSVFFWYTFDAESNWFDQVAWDFGFMALDTDGTYLAVLAVTDMD